MRGTITKWSGLILAGALALSVLALAACGGGDSTNSLPNGGNQAGALGLANLLNSTSGAAVYEQLLQGAGASTVSGIWVNGQGEASAKPDLALLNLGVEAFANTVAEARTDGAAAMKQVLGVLAGQGVEDRDIQTRFFNINPQYTSHEVMRCFSTGHSIDGGTTERQTTIEPEPQLLPQGSPVSPSSKPQVATSGEISVLQVKPGSEPHGEECVTERESVLLGYEVNNQLNVKIRDLDAIGRVIDTVTEAAGNLIRFQGISFTIEDDQALKDQARAAAVEDLMDKAAQTATLAGVELGELVYITESGGSVSPQSFRGAIAFAEAVTPIQTGELQVRVSLQAAFDIDPTAN